MEFINTLNQTTFSATNAHWNDLQLNDPWSVGYVSSLIESKKFNSKEDWESFYYNSGRDRNRKMARLSEHITLHLNNYNLKKNNPKAFFNLNSDIKNLNLNFGRTKGQLAKKGKLLFESVTKNNITITLEDCIESVRFRTICETWNGIIIRERNTIKVLKTRFPNIEFIKTSGEFDHKYAVDYELKKDDTLICAIQIKPKSYTYNLPYVLKAKNANQRKNKLYSDCFKKPVFDVISQANGTVINTEVIKQLEKLLQTRF